MKGRIVHFGKKYGKELLLAGLLILPNLSALFLSSDLKESWTMKGGYLLFFLILWVLPFLFLKARTVFLILGLWLVISPVEIGHLYYMGLSATPTMLRTILVTNWKEAIEMLGGVWLLLIPHLLLCIGYYYVAFHVRNRYLFSWRWRKILIGIFILFNGVLYGMMWKGIPQQQKAIRMLTAKDRLLKKYYKVYPFSFFSFRPASG